MEKKQLKVTRVLGRLSRTQLYLVTGISIFLSLLLIRYSVLGYWLDNNQYNKDWIFDKLLILVILISVVFLGLMLRSIMRLKGELIGCLQAEKRIEKLAFYDLLTGLPNRLLCYERLDHIIEEARNNNSILAVLFVDLDNFKVINDTLGYHYGNILIEESANRLFCNLSEKDTLSRIGSDEFIIILEDVKEAEHAALVAGKLLEAMDQAYDLEGNQIYISSSIGISIFPGDGNDAEEIIRNADTAMYHAKQIGKNNFQFFSKEMNEYALRKLSISVRLRQALENKQLEIYYQPLIDIGKGVIEGVEALLRWHDPEMGFISPAEFIPLAEENGMIIPIGEWVLRAACQQNKAWQLAGLPPVVVSVNLSNRQLWHEGFVETVQTVLEETGLDPQYLELELTESAVMKNAEAAVRRLSQLKALGVSIALDDFGTGYSSMTYLKRLNLDRLKIDRSFIKDLPADNEDVAITKAIISLAKSIRLLSTAEGVETEEQLKFLQEQHCEGAQGYLFSRPVTAAELEVLLRSTMSLVAVKCSGGSI